MWITFIEIFKNLSNIENMNIEKQALSIEITEESVQIKGLGTIRHYKFLKEYPVDNQEDELNGIL